MALKPVTAVNALSLHSSIANCMHARKVQLPALSFQLLARATRTSVPHRSPIHKQVSWLHTAQSKPNTDEQTLTTEEGTVIEQPRRTKRKQSRPAQQVPLDTGLTRYNNESLDKPPIESAGPKDIKNTTGKTKDGAVQQEYDGIDQVGSVPPVESETYKQYMRVLTHPVVIITSTDLNVDSRGEPHSWRGATVSSFNSVTVKPWPCVSFNIKKLSSTYNAIRSSKMFAVHIMNNHSAGVVLATRFTWGNNAKPFSSNPWGGDGYGSDKLGSFVKPKVVWHGQDRLPIRTRSLPPLLQLREKDPATGIESKAVIFRMLCEFQEDKTVEIGDHVVVFGKVIRLLDGLFRETPEGPKLKYTPCLTYAVGKFSTDLRNTSNKAQQSDDAAENTEDRIRELFTTPS